MSQEDKTERTNVDSGIFSLRCTNLTAYTQAII